MRALALVLLVGCGSGADFTTSHGALVHTTPWEMDDADFDSIERSILALVGAEPAADSFARVEAWISDHDSDCGGTLTAGCHTRSLGPRPSHILARSYLGCPFTTGYGHEILHAWYWQHEGDPYHGHERHRDVFDQANNLTVTTMWRCW